MTPGSHLGRFQIKELLGEGGMGQVYRALDTELQRDVALKVLLPELSADDQFAERFKREAIIQAKLHHPNVAQFHDLIREQGYFIMVMEFVDGMPLDDLLGESGPLPLSRAIALFGQILDAVDSAHTKGVIHRDIKPGNILVSKDGAVKVVDFGIARAMGDRRMTKTGRLVGTPNYMAPEQILDREMDARTDIYALGIVLYEILAGKRPFARTSEYEVLRWQMEEMPEPLIAKGIAVPAGIERVISRAMAKNPDERFQEVSEFKAALLLAEGGNVPAAPVAEAIPMAGFATHREESRPKLVWLRVGAVLAAAVGGLIWFAAQPSDVAKLPVPPKEAKAAEQVKPEDKPPVKEEPVPSAKKEEVVEPAAPPKTAAKTPLKSGGKRTPEKKPEDELERIRMELKGNAKD